MIDSPELDPRLRPISEDPRSTESVEQARIKRVAKLEACKRGELVLDRWGHYEAPQIIEGVGLPGETTVLFEVFRSPDEKYDEAAREAKERFLEGKEKFDTPIIYFGEATVEAIEVLINSANWRE